MKKGKAEKCIGLSQVAQPRFRCQVCGDVLGGIGLREHLESHHPGAANLSGEEVRNEFTVEPAERVIEALAECGGQADRESIVRACVCLPAGAVDWRLLRKQKAVLAALILDGVTPGPLREVFEGIISMLDDIQDRAEPVLGTQAVFGRK